MSKNGTKVEALETDLTEDEERLAEELQAKMDKMDFSTADADDDDDDSTPAKEDKQAEEDAEETESTPVKSKTEDTDEGAGDEDGISDALYRAAVHQGWTPEDIKEFVDASPELAKKTFEKLYTSTNKITSEFARFGRAKVEQEQGQAQSKATAGDAGAKSGPVDLAALKEEYGEDSAIVKTMEAVLSAFPKAAAIPAPAAAAAATNVPDENLRQMIGQFFTADQMKLYNDFYGSGNDRNKLTYEQSMNRHKVLEMADFILLGAEAHGRKMDVTEALERAHLSVTEPIRATIIRKDIVAKAIKKAKGVSLKPSSPISKPKSKASTEKDLEALVGQKLSQIF